jgi:hypothetical protein
MLQIPTLRHAAWLARGAGLRRAAVAGAMLLGSTLPGWAQQPTQAQANAIRQSCRADYQSHCASVPTGGSAALACLQQNASSLSPPCQQALAAVGGGGGAAGATAPGARPMSPAYGAAPPPRARPPLSPREEMAMVRADCGRDYRRFCQGVPLGGGRGIACLKANGPQLTRQCQSMLLSLRRQGR